MSSEDGGVGTISSSRTVRRSRFSAGTFRAWTVFAPVDCLAVPPLRAADLRAVVFRPRAAVLADLFAVRAFLLVFLEAVFLDVDLVRLRPARFAAPPRPLAAAALRLAIVVSFRFNEARIESSKRVT